MKKSILFLFFLFFILAACGAPAMIYIPQTTAPEQTTPAPQPVSLRLFFEQSNHLLGRHEPAKGVLLGAYIQSDPTAGSIAQFNETVGADHAIFAHTMQLGDSLPLRWVLENIAVGAAPFITLLPPEDSPNPFNFSLLEDFIHDIALFNTPAFVQLFPICANSNFIPFEYIAFFNRAYTMFEAYAPNVALTWGFDAGVQATASHFFPGENSVHWINLTVYNHICPEGYFENMNTLLSNFHAAFSHVAPLVLTTAASSYCILSNRRFPVQAAEKITNIYGQIITFPRIRAIIYQNYNDIPSGGADFRVNHTEIITQAYQSAVLATHFLNYFPKQGASEYGITSQKSPYPALMIDYRFYVPQATFDLPTLPIIPINGRLYHPLYYVLDATSSDFFVNLNLGTITIQNP